MIYKVIMNHHPRARAVPGSKAYMACRPVAPDALSIGLPVWLARGCSCKTCTGFPWRREERAWGGKRGPRRLHLGRVPEEAQASRRARTHLHTLQSRRARAAAAPARRASDSCCNSVRGSPEEPASGRRGRAPRRKERREPGLARAGTELAWLPDRGRVSAPAAPLAAGPTPARCLCSGAASSAAARKRLEAGLGGSRSAAKTLQVADAALPVTPNYPLVQAARENASLLTSGSAFCSLWFGREPTWSCGH